MPPPFCCLPTAAFHKRFYKTEKIACTPFSSVYGCKSDIESNLVVKIQNPLVNSNSIQNEIRILRHLQDEHHAATLVFAEVRLCTSYIVCERIVGPTLNVYLVQHLEASFQDKILLANQLLHAFQCLQRRHIVHRDIKYDNILIDTPSCAIGEPCVRVIDFGLSVCQPNLRAYAHNEVAGTYAFQCPEMYCGMCYNAGCDTWSLGVLLYRLLVGKAPYTVTRSEVQHCHRFRVLPEGIRRLTLDGVADAKVRAWLGRMLVVRREERALLGELGRVVVEEEDDTTAGG